MPTRIMPDFTERRSVRRANNENDAAMRVCYAAARQNGWLSRTDWEWTHQVWSDDYERVVYAGSDDSVEGYLVFRRGTDSNDTYVRVIEWVATTDEAWRGVAGFLSALGEQTSVIRYNAPRKTPLVQALREPHSAGGEWSVEWIFREVARLVSGFMLRIVHLPAALRKRGYPPGITANFVLRVDDEQLTENSSPLRVQIADGAANVAPAADGTRATLHTDMTTFSELYAGTLTAEQARRVGRLRADDATCAVVTRAFAATPLYMHRVDWF